MVPMNAPPPARHASSGLCSARRIRRGRARSLVFASTKPAIVADLGLGLVSQQEVPAGEPDEVGVGDPLRHLSFACVLSWVVHCLEDQRRRHHVVDWHVVAARNVTWLSKWMPWVRSEIGIDAERASLTASDLSCLLMLRTTGLRHEHAEQSAGGGLDRNPADEVVVDDQWRDGSGTGPGTAEQSRIRPWFRCG